MTIRRGTVYLADMPHQAKPRPAIILTADWLSQYARDVTVIPVTSSAHTNFPTGVELQAGDGGMQTRSWAKCDQVTRIPVSLLKRPAFGRLDAAKMKAIEEAVRLALGL